MDKNTIFFGIDISKKVFDVVDCDNQHYEFPNSVKGFRTFKKLLPPGAVCVMEATGYYHLGLAYFLWEHHIKVSVINPLRIKRFVQMHLTKVKTDKSDARMIRLYAESNPLKLWYGQSENQKEALQIVSLLDTYIKQATALKNKLKGEKALGTPSSLVIKSMKRNLKGIKKERELLEQRLLELVRLDNKELLTNLESIPGLGRKTAMMLIVFTDGFRRFESAAALCSYCGTTPIIRKSGTSVNSRPRISKIGNQKIRNLLFMCSFSASKRNRACNELFTRITSKGKSKKLALIAVSNKLLKQAYAIAKSGIPYDENYRSVLPVS